MPSVSGGGRDIAGNPEVTGRGGKDSESAKAVRAIPGNQNESGVLKHAKGFHTKENATRGIESHPFPGKGSLNFKYCVKKTNPVPVQGIILAD